jgi:hypothetical protein
MKNKYIYVVSELEFVQPHLSVKQASITPDIESYVATLNDEKQLDMQSISHELSFEFSEEVEEI